MNFIRCKPISQDETTYQLYKSVMERIRNSSGRRNGQDGTYVSMRPHLLLPALALLLLLLQSVTSSNDQPDSLQLVHIIFRHGERTPADTYPLDPHVQHKFEPYGWGQLTNKGKQDQFQQGEWLRHRYNQFLGDVYSPALLQAQCTDVDRTKMSTQLLLAGLYPPRGEQVWNSALLWQPIPVDSETLKYDKVYVLQMMLLLGRYPCPRYQEELDRLFSTPEVQSILDSNRGLLEYATRQSGLTVATPDDAQSLYSTLRAEKDFGLDLPEWTKKIFPEPLKKITAESFVINAMTSVLQRLKGGFLLKKIIDDTSDKLEGRSRMKMFAYGGHDSTVSNFLLALDTWDTQIPEYNSLILVEVHQIQPNRHGVKIFLRNSTTEDPYPLRVPGCDLLCPWDSFLRLTSKKVPTKSYTEECKSKNPNFKYRESTSGP